MARDDLCGKHASNTDVMCWVVLSGARQTNPKECCPLTKLTVHLVVHKLEVRTVWRIDCLRSRAVTCHPSRSTDMMVEIVNCSRANTKLNTCFFSSSTVSCRDPLMLPPRETYIRNSRSHELWKWGCAVQLPKINSAK